MASKNYIKVCLVGDGGVEKTALLRRYLKPDCEFNENMPLTIFMNCETKKVQIQEKEEYILILYDFGGQERFRFLLNEGELNRVRPDVVILAFDLTDLQTFCNLERYYKLVSNGPAHNSGILLVGSKADLELEREVPVEEIKAFCESKNISYIEVSAKTGEKIEPLFQKVVECHITNRENTHETPSEDKWNNLTGNCSKGQHENSCESHWNI